MPTAETLTKTEPLQSESVLRESAELERQAESTLALLIERQKNGYRRGIDDDGHKIGLAFDAGGLAGVVGAAMGRKLELLGLLDCVDAFYGTSAGSFNALYAACGRLRQGIDIYKDIAPDNEMVKPGRTFPPKLPRMNAGVLRDAFYRTRPIDVKKIVGERIPVVIGATDLSDPFKRKAVFRSTDLTMENANQLIEQALAGSQIPVIGGAPVELENGHLFVDASLSMNAIDLAIDDKCTHVLSLANFPQSEPEPETSKQKIARVVIGGVGDKYLDKHSPDLPSLRVRDLSDWVRHPVDSLGATLLDYIGGDRTVYDIKRYKDVLKQKEEMARSFNEELFIYQGVNVERLYPPDIPDLPELLTMDKKKLRVGIKAGRLAVRKALQNAIQNK